MHFLENSMFVLNAYLCCELRFVAILRSKLRFLLRNTGVDSDFSQNFWGKIGRLKSLLRRLALLFSVSSVNQNVKQSACCEKMVPQSPNSAPKSQFLPFWRCYSMTCSLYLGPYLYWKFARSITECMGCLGFPTSANTGWRLLSSSACQCF